MNEHAPYVLWLDELGVADVPRVGGKNASLGELITQLEDALAAAERGETASARSSRPRSPGG